MQFTAAKLWEARDRERRLLTRDSYERLGGVAGALSAHADAVLSALPSARAAAGPGGAGAPGHARAHARGGQPGRAARARTGRRGAAGEAIAQVVQHLAGARLLLLETARRPAERARARPWSWSTSRLIERWPKLGQWLAESEQDAQFLARLRAAAQQWEASGQAEGLLWRDRAAHDAEGVARAPPRRAQAPTGASGLGKREERYLLAVVALAERARGVCGGGLARGMIATLTRDRGHGVVGTAGDPARRAGSGSCRARRSPGGAQRHPHGRGARAAGRSHDRARDLARGRAARCAARVGTSSRAGRCTAGSLAWCSPIRMRSFVQALAPTASASSPRRGTRPCGCGTRMARASRWSFAVTTSRPVGGVQPRRQAHRHGVAGQDRAGVERRWHGRAGGPSRSRGAGQLGAAFSPDGKRIVTASLGQDRAGVERGWHGRAPGPSGSRGGGSRSVAFSPDGKRIVTASQDKTARVWKRGWHGRAPGPSRSRGRLTSAAFSPDGKRIVTASWDKTARVWNADGTGEPWSSAVTRRWSASAAFSPDGKRIVTASLGQDRAGVERRWYGRAPGPSRSRGGGLLGGVQPRRQAHRHGVRGQDRAGVERRGPGEPLVLRGHEDPVCSAAFSPDGKRIVTGS